MGDTILVVESESKARGIVAQRMKQKELEQLEQQVTTMRDGRFVAYYRCFCMTAPACETVVILCESGFVIAMEEATEPAVLLHGPCNSNSHYSRLNTISN